ncbi:Bug family tripartite tricarboxylate transporter substrate binding protein [Limnochorda pilosa]|uniref:C4-dicarboxylate ABC transporter substrate-binding protein n=1 Tax=Limnochorda pilosa TaxID=1555112 RepID=A0A0K2SJA4_LIMPI|nr:tripartite tricarboxylate transporter substrate binding protein [Limnochorda pilosa]BAS27160.1 C4-dicarboxylate ABC transporter substrate-binding protein [Limnochorda pilosa]
MRRTHGIRWVAAAVMFLVLLAAHPAVWAQGYPSKPIEYVIPFNPGGESDITARIQEQALERILGVNVNVTYKPGAGGALAWSQLKNLRPDGYTIMGANLPHTVLQPLQRGDAGYTTEGIHWAYIFESTPNVLVVRPDSPFKTLADFIAFAKENPEVITLGGSGSWTANHLGVLELEKAAGIDLTYIPFTGSGAAVPAFLGGHVTGLMTYNTMAVQYPDQMRVLAVASERRLESLPGVPTFKELGYDYVEGAYRGVAVPPGTPREIVRKLEDAFAQVNADPEVRRKMDENGFIIEDMRSDEANAFARARIPLYRQILQDVGAIN